MRCRQIKNNEVVWFNSIGKYSNNKKISADNFVEDRDAVVSSLTQRLSVLRKELWYRISYGLPLFEKIKSKVFMDSEVIQIITSHPDVIKIKNFTSRIQDKNYIYSAEILTVYGETELNSQNNNIN